MRLIVALTLVLSFIQKAEAIEVWLASSPDCNSCQIYQRAAQRRGYGRTLRYAGDERLAISVLSINKSALADDILSQLPEDLGPGDPSWDVTLTVLVMDVGRVLFAGNIAESADNNELRRSSAVMFPPASPEEGDPALSEESVYADFFEEHWNLEYFVDVALGKRPRRLPVSPVDLAAASPAALGASNIILWGSAATPLQNALFIPTRIADVRETLVAMSLGPIRYVTLYGHGPGVQGNDTSYLADGRTRFKHAEVNADFAADADGLNSVLTGVLQSEGARTLLVQVGHSGPAGSPLWGHGLTLAPEDIEPIKRESSGSMIMLSGACNSGAFAKAVQCGFFAAHPEVTASGCQLSTAALETSDDYLHHFLGAASGPAPGDAGTRRRKAQPATLYDAHWYASTRIEDHQLSFTTTDALIDDYFAGHPEDLPAALSVADIRDAAATMTRSEAAAAAELTEGLTPETLVPLTGYVEANHKADALLEDARELSSAERNRIAALPHKLVLSLLARRIAYAALKVSDADYAVAESCERQSLQEFLGNGR